ncbi:NAD(P)H-dependent oxidoreductase [Flavobacterium sp.]|uniref:NAD(P)H-dependent oxidoreductase n=1 Tax=Flavobacterium sp. TaxID=239 RepID=UPI003A8E2D79
MALIILAHPNIKNSVANKTVIEELQKNNTDIEVRDIYELYPDFKIDPKAEQQTLLKHKTIVFQYPFYWYNMPAILKHWFDVVYEYQFAFGSKGDKLEGKNFLSSFTIGGAEKEYKTFGEHNFRIHEFCKNLEQTAYKSKMTYIDPIYFYETSLTAGFSSDDITVKAKNHARKLLAILNDLA